VLSQLWRPLGASALSDQLAARAVTMGERLGSDHARCSTQITDSVLVVDAILGEMRCTEERVWLAVLSG
jgi:hypothetical protein